MTGMKGSTESSQVVEFRRAIREMLQGRLSEAIEAVLEEELEGVLGSGWYERSERRRGYRNGTVGLWTKADARTHFDDSRAKELRR